MDRPETVFRASLASTLYQTDIFHPTKMCKIRGEALLRKSVETPALEDRLVRTREGSSSNVTGVNVSYNCL